jgi:hypothetical protein
MGPHRTHYGTGKLLYVVRGMLLFVTEWKHHIEQACTSEQNTTSLKTGSRQNILFSFLILQMYGLAGGFTSARAH